MLTTGYTEEEKARLTELARLLRLSEEEAETENFQLAFVLEETERIICEELRNYAVPSFFHKLWIAFAAEFYLLYGKGSAELQRLTEGDVSVSYHKKDREALIRFYRRLLWGAKKARW